ncbi:MAG: benzoate/H(+) symporter BenE family transporter [Phyllobacteriaceae bacterium]|nr:benzoate/H(+) symporter BenE family transporter [Phyllobacteriaceae bacterium]
MIMEPGYSLRDSFSYMLKNLNAAGVGNGFVAFLFSTLGPGLIVLNAAKQGGLTDAQSVSWLFAIYAMGGLCCMYIALRYRLPVSIAYSIPGAVILGGLLKQYSINQAVGAYLVIALVTLALTISGVIKKVVEHIPVAIMLAMVSGVFVSFGVNLFKGAIGTPSIYGVMVVVYFACMAFRRLSQIIPPILPAIAVGVILLILNGKLVPVGVPVEFATLNFVAPEFNIGAIINIGIPLFFLVVGVQNIQAVGVLMAEGYKPPINATYIVPGLASIINAILGAHNAVCAGPSTAICCGPNSGPRKELRFIASFSEGIFWFLFALCAKMAVEAVKMVPAEFAAVLAGLAMFEVFGSAFKGAFTGKFKAGAMVAFFVCITNQPIFGIGSPFWAILLGILTSLVVERQDFTFFAKVEPPVGAEAEVAAQ